MKITMFYPQEKRWLGHEHLSFKGGTTVVTEDSKAFPSS